MKRVLLIATLLFSVHFSKAQHKDYSAFIGILGTTSEHIIESQNIFLNMEGYSLTLRDARDTKEGFSLIYSSRFEQSQTTHIYKFNKLNVCFEYSQIMDTPAYYEEVKDIKLNFQSVGNNLYIHPQLNLEVLISLEPGKKFGMIKYSKK